MGIMDRPRIAVTMGVPAGIGPEVCLHVLQSGAVAERCVPVVFGDSDVMNRCADATGLPAPEYIITQAEWEADPTTIDTPTLLDLRAITSDQYRPGEVNAETGRAAYACIEASIEAALRGTVAAVTTAPINKEALRASGVSHPGHTEIFTEKTGATRSCMMLTSDALTCSFVTAHVGYRDVPALLRVARVVDVIELSAEAMRRIRRRAPKLLVCGLNPHAGEHGLFGNMEETIITPAIEKTQAEGIDVVGPLPPDTAFLPAQRDTIDCFVCMYHDQGHIPLKALAFDRAINCTLGLPIIRTSVDHGTACDIAWQGRADPNSLFEAVLLAAQLAQDEGGPLSG